MLFLASGSPRRRALLASLLPDGFQVDSPDVDESVGSELDPITEAVTVAARKAGAVRDRHPDHLVLGADTTLAVAGRSLGQAADETDATAMLRTQSGQRVLVTTGLSLIGPSVEYGGSVTAAVELREIGDDEIVDYIESGAWIGKAGALEVQGAAAPFVREVIGCLGTVIGLPVCEVARLLDVDDPCVSARCVAETVDLGTADS